MALKAPGNQGDIAMKKGLSAVLLLFLILVLAAGCNGGSGGGSSPGPATLRFYCNTWEDEPSDGTLQVERAALINGLGDIQVLGDGSISASVEGVTLDHQVYVPGWAGSIPVDLTIGSMILSGEFNRNSLTGQGDFSAEYTMSGEADGISTEVTQTLTGEFTISEAEYGTHQEEGRLFISLSGTGNRVQTFTFDASYGQPAEDPVNEFTGDWSDEFVLEVIQ